MPGSTDRSARRDSRVRGDGLERRGQVEGEQGTKSLADAHKSQNKAEAYRAQIRALHDRGICVMAGFISGFDSDRPETITAMARQLYEVGVDVPFLSVLTPFPGTPVYQKYQAEGRILPDRGWEFYNGYNVAFQPKEMTPEELLAAHRALWREAFSFRYSLKRIARAFFTLRWGAFLMCAFMNGFYCLKALRGNLPRAFDHKNPYREFSRQHLAAMREETMPANSATPESRPETEECEVMT